MEKWGTSTAGEECLRVYPSSRSRRGTRLEGRRRGMICNEVDRFYERGSQLLEMFTICAVEI